MGKDGNTPLLVRVYSDTPRWLYETFKQTQSSKTKCNKKKHTTMNKKEGYFEGFYGFPGEA